MHAREESAQGDDQLRLRLTCLGTSLYIEYLSYCRRENEKIALIKSQHQSPLPPTPMFTTLEKNLAKQMGYH